MGSQGKKLIGLILEDLFSDYAKDTIHSVTKALTSRRDIRLVVISGRRDERKDPNSTEYYYKTVYNSIYRLEELCPFDGLIISLGGTIDKSELSGHFGERFRNVPKVFIASSIPDEITVNYDNASGIREAVDYLVKVEGFTRIGMLGGRDNNPDAVERKQIFIKCLENNNIAFSDSMYEKTNMSDDCERDAESLLERNPDIQAVFCVNDAVAKGLYEVMKRKGLVPGKDIAVFGFDNTRMSADIIPPLTSIGSNSDAPGQAAVDLILKMLNGESVSSVLIPTTLFGRESFRYDSYDYHVGEIKDFTGEFIDKMFDDCFYRYKNEIHDRENIDLKRLFHEFMSRMLMAMQHKYMSLEEFNEIGRLIDTFFYNGAMDYTDADKFVKSIERIQGAINRVQKSVLANVRINRLFARSKDRAIQSLSRKRVERERFTRFGRGKMKDFMVDVVDYSESGSDGVERIVTNFDKLGFKNAALYLFTDPVKYDFDNYVTFPTDIELKCLMKAGELFVLPKERRRSTLTVLFTREELALNCSGFVALPVFYGKIIFGVLICELTGDIPDRGDYVADLLGRTLYIAHDLHLSDRSI